MLHGSDTMKIQLRKGDLFLLQNRPKQRTNSPGRILKSKVVERKLVQTKNTAEFAGIRVQRKLKKKSGGEAGGR